MLDVFFLWLAFSRVVFWLLSSSVWLIWLILFVGQEKKKSESRAHRANAKNFSFKHYLSSKLTCEKENLLWREVSTQEYAFVSKVPVFFFSFSLVVVSMPVNAGLHSSSFIHPCMFVLFSAKNFAYLGICKHDFFLLPTYL